MQRVSYKHFIPPSTQQPTLFMMLRLIILFSGLGCVLGQTPTQLLSPTELKSRGALVTILDGSSAETAVINGGTVMLKTAQRIRVCVRGDLCVADSTRAKRAPGCEWLTDGCRCYHWNLERFHAGDAIVRWSSARPHCALLEFHHEGTFPVSLTFALTQYEGRLPSGVLRYAIQKYKSYVKEAKNPVNGIAFLKMLQRRQCNPDADSPMELADRCERNVELVVRKRM